MIYYQHARAHPSASNIQYHTDCPYHNGCNFHIVFSCGSVGSRTLSILSQNQKSKKIQLYKHGTGLIYLFYDQRTTPFYRLVLTDLPAFKKCFYDNTSVPLQCIHQLISQKKINVRHSSHAQTNRRCAHRWLYCQHNMGIGLLFENSPLHTHTHIHICLAVEYSISSPSLNTNTYPWCRLGDSLRNSSDDFPLV